MQPDTWIEELSIPLDSWHSIKTRDANVPYVLFSHKLSPFVQGATSDNLMQQSPQVLQCHLKDKGVYFYGRISQG